MPNFPKKQQQCLIPKYLLDYAEELQENHPDPSAEWGGGSGGDTIQAGTGIVITTESDDTKTISVDTDDVAMVASLSTVAFSGDYDDLEDKPTIPTDTSDLTNGAGFITGIDSSDVITALGYTPGTSNFDGDYDSLTNKPTDLSDFNNDVGYITGIDSSDVITALGYTPGTSNFSGDYTDLTNKPTIPTDTSDLTNGAGYITSSALNGYATEYWVGQQGYLTSVTWNDVSGKPSFATVATSGDYTDLINKPTIPTVNDSTVTLQVNGTTAGSFTTNQSSASTINLSVPTGSTVVTITTSLGVGTGTVTQAQYDALLNNPDAILEFKGYYHADGSWYMRQVYNTVLTGDLIYELFEVSKSSGSAGNASVTKVTISSNLSWTLSANSVSGVSGTNDGTNWTSLTIDSNTYNIPSGSTPSNMVTINTAQNITGAKTFKGEDKLVLQGTTTSQKPGFAILDGNDDKRGFLELRPSTGDKTMVLGVYNKSNYTDTSVYRIGLREYNQSYSNYTYSTLMPKGSDKYTTFGSGNMNMVLGVNGQKADDSGNVSLTVPTTATSTVTPTTGTFVTGTTTTTTSLVFTYTDNTTETITLVTAVTDSTSSAMTGATVTTTLS